MTQIRERLFELQDTTYQAFQSKLMPTVDPDTVIGGADACAAGAGERDRARGGNPGISAGAAPTPILRKTSCTPL